MSKFVTPFPFPLEELKELLPKGSYFERVIWNKEQCQLELHWEHDPWRTGLDHPVEFGPDALRAGKLPIEVRQSEEEAEAVRIARHFPPLIIVPEDPIALAQEPAEPAEAAAPPPGGGSGPVRTSGGKNVSDKAAKAKSRT